MKDKSETKPSTSLCLNFLDLLTNLVHAATPITGYKSFSLKISAIVFKLYVQMTYKVLLFKNLQKRGLRDELSALCVNYTIQFYLQNLLEEIKNAIF